MIDVQTVRAALEDELITPKVKGLLRLALTELVTANARVVYSRIERDAYKDALAKIDPRIPDAHENLGCTFCGDYALAMQDKKRTAPKVDEEHTADCIWYRAKHGGK